MQVVKIQLYTLNISYKRARVALTPNIKQSITLTWRTVHATKKVTIYEEKQLEIVVVIPPTY